MTSMPASRNARAMILAPRSWPSSPGFAMTTRIFRATAGSLISLRLLVHRIPRVRAWRLDRPLKRRVAGSVRRARHRRHDDEQHAGAPDRERDKAQRQKTG